MQFKAAIFDLDGTLLNTLEDLADSMNCVLERNRLPRHDLAAYKYFVGDGIDMLVQRALPFEVASENEFQRFVREMKTEYAGRWLNKTKPYPGILEMLAAFAAAGFETAVLSNKPDDATSEIIKVAYAGPLFPLGAGRDSGTAEKAGPIRRPGDRIPLQHFTSGLSFHRRHLHRYANGPRGRHVPGGCPVGLQARRRAAGSGRKIAAERGCGFNSLDKIIEHP